MTEAAPFLGHRLEELRVLKNGWLDGMGFAPSPGALEWLAQRFAADYPDDLPLPHLYPTAEGGVQVEWSVVACEVTLDIRLDDHRGAWHLLNMETGEESTRDLNLDDDEDWRWLDAQIRQQAGCAQ